MSRRISRRDFVKAGAAAGLAAAAPIRAAAQAPSVLTPRGVSPVVIASANGNRFKNGGPQVCVEKAFSLMTSGEDVLDAVIAGVNIVPFLTEGYEGFDVNRPYDWQLAEELVKGHKRTTKVVIGARSAAHILCDERMPVIGVRRQPFDGRRFKGAQRPRDGPAESDP